jgi:L-malate glycosyltransferase
MNPKQKTRFIMIVSGYPPAKTAGMERACQRLAQGLVRQNQQVLVITQHSLGQEKITNEEGVVVHRTIAPLAFGPLWGATYMAQVRRTLKKTAEQWDFCLSHKLDLHSVVTAPLCRALGKNSAVLLHNTGQFSDIKLLRQHKGGSILLNRALQNQGFFHLSGVSRQELSDQGVSPDRLFPYRNFLDLSNPEGSQPRKKKTDFLFMGRFHPQKNVPLLIQAFEEVHLQRPKATLRLIGKGPEEQLVQELAENSPSKSAITLESWTDDPKRALEESKALVLSSRSEGMPYVVVEAMAAAVPVIMPDVSGARETLAMLSPPPAQIPQGEFFQGGAGLITPVNDKKALASAMIHLLDNETLQEKLGANGKQTANDNFNEQSCIDLFLQGVDSIQKLGRRQ